MIDANVLISRIEMWGRGKGIIGNSTPVAQAAKTIEEVDELLDAIAKGDINEMADAYGDIIVTCIMGASCAGLDIKECLLDVYNTISKRTGELNDQGVFVKDE